MSTPDSAPKRPKLTEDQIVGICQRFMDAAPTAIEYPGGRGRRSAVAVIGDRRVVVSLRASVGRARLEASVLSRLQDTGLVPHLIGRKDTLVVQAYVPGSRLSQVLDSATPTDASEFLKSASTSLVDLQNAASDAGLQDIAPEIGARPGWTKDLLGVPAHLARIMGLPMPQLDFDTLAALLTPATPVFVKWDARPGNAIVGADGRLCWFDWEHCGLRAESDDLAWLLADEWSPSSLDAERHAAGLTGDGAERLFTMEILHSCVRMSLILARKGDGPWWSHQACLEQDRVGVTEAHLRRLATRMQRWLPFAPCLFDLRRLAETIEAKH